MIQIEVSLWNGDGDRVDGGDDECGAGGDSDGRVDMGVAMEMVLIFLARMVLEFVHAFGWDRSTT